MAGQSSARPAAIDALTGIRFFAAVGVMAFHFGAGYLTRAGIPTPISHILQNGFLGVSVFFVLSGFILTYSHQGQIVDKAFFGRFYLARFARIYPVYLLVLCIYLPFTEKNLEPYDVFRVLFMTQAWTTSDSSYGFTWLMQAWTLSVEVCFYLMFPFILSFFQKASAVWSIIVAGLAAILIWALGLSSVSPGAGTGYQAIDAMIPLPLLRSVEFLYGMALCRVVTCYPDLCRRLSGTFAELCMVGIIGLSLSLATTAGARSVITVLCGLELVQFYFANGIVSRFLSGPRLILLGGASYALYLVSGPVHAMSMSVLPDHFARLVSPIATVGAAVIIFVAWEQPCRRFILAIGRPRMLAGVRR